MCPRDTPMKITAPTPWITLAACMISRPCCQFGKSRMRPVTVSVIPRTTMPSQNQLFSPALNPPDAGSPSAKRYPAYRVNGPLRKARHSRPVDWMSWLVSTPGIDAYWGRSLTLPHAGGLFQPGTAVEPLAGVGGDETAGDCT